MKYIDEVAIHHKRVLIRVDFNVALNPNHSIADDARIRQSIPTLDYLLKQHNKLILIAHLGQPEKRNPADSLIRIAKRLHEYLPGYKVTLVNDFLTDTQLFAKQQEHEILLLENIRFYPGEQTNDRGFARALAALGDVYVNDGFSVSHRKSASVVGIPKHLPSYGGLLLKKELTMLRKLLEHPKKPFVAIIGGKKITTKITFINKLASLVDYLLLGGGLANTFLIAQGHHIGNNLAIAPEDIAEAKRILHLAQTNQTHIVLPTDVVVGKSLHSHVSEVKNSTEVIEGEQILDIGPETQARFGAILDKAKTIVWNGPVGYMENPVFKRGTDFLYYVITENTSAVSVIGGGDTLAAIADKAYLEKITHISTGGGAMLEFVERGTLPGIEALKNAKSLR